MAFITQGETLSFFRYVQALTPITAGKCSFPLSASSISSPVMDSHGPAALTTPGDLRQVLKLIALIWAKGDFLQKELPQKTAE